LDLAISIGKKGGTAIQRLMRERMYETAMKLLCEIKLQRRRVMWGGVEADEGDLVAHA
jgi:hypothetical protein